MNRPDMLIERSIDAFVASRGVDYTLFTIAAILVLAVFVFSLYVLYLNKTDK